MSAQGRLKQLPRSLRSSSFHHSQFTIPLNYFTSLSSLVAGLCSSPRTFSEVDFLVLQVVDGVHMDEPLVRFCQLALEARRHSKVQAVRRNHGLLRNQGSGGDDRTLAYPNIVEEHRAYPDQTVVFN